MPEKTRVVRRPEGEPNYHIFYQLLSGADSDLRRTLGLENLSEPNLFMTPLQRVSSARVVVVVVVVEGGRKKAAVASSNNNSNGCSNNCDSSSSICSNNNNVFCS